MSADTIVITVKKYTTCPLCDEQRVIMDEEDHSVTYSELHMELEDVINDAIAEQAEDDGWEEGYCPECAENRADEIRRIETAEEYGDYRRDDMQDWGGE